MKIKERLRNTEWVLIPIILIIGAFYGGSRYGQYRAERSVISVRDTVTEVVTIYKDFPQPQKAAVTGFVQVPRYMFLTDTLKTVEKIVLHDTTVVYLPREQKYYVEADGALRIWVSGYEPRLDRYEFDLTTTTITNTMKPPRWGVSIGGGYGISLNKERQVIASPYIGIGLTYTLFYL